MSPMAISLIVFLCVFGGAMLGMFLRAVLPQHHLNPDSKDVIKSGIGLVATMAALVLARNCGVKGTLTRRRDPT